MKEKLLIVEDQFVEADYLHQMLLKENLSAIVTDPAGWEHQLLNIGKTLQPYIPFDYITAGLNTIGDPSSRD